MSESPTEASASRSPKMIPEVNCWATRGKVIAPGLEESSAPGSTSTPGSGEVVPGSLGDSLVPGDGELAEPSGKSAAVEAPTSAVTVRGLSCGLRKVSPGGSDSVSSVTVYSPSSLTATDQRPSASVVASP